MLRVNRRTLELFEAKDAQHLLANLDRVFRDAMLEPHLEELVSLWQGIGIASIRNAASRPCRTGSTAPISVIQWTRVSTRTAGA